MPVRIGVTFLANRLQVNQKIAPNRAVRKVNVPYTYS